MNLARIIKLEKHSFAVEEPQIAYALELVRL